MISRKTYAELQALECEESIAPYRRTLDGKEAEEILLKNPSAKEVTYYDDEELNAIRYNERMTYNMPQTGDPTQPMRVPKGAEVLLETRFPYLNADQRRWVLYSTGLPSGYVFLDDAEAGDA